MNSIGRGNNLLLLHVKQCRNNKVFNLYPIIPILSNNLTNTPIQFNNSPLNNNVTKRLFSSNNSSSTGPKVYTKTGDKGTSSLFNLERRPKSDTIFNALGSVDELNAHIGLNIDYLKYYAKNNSKLTETLLPQLESIQNSLFSLGSAVATPRKTSSSNQIEATKFNADNHLSLELEQWIDGMTSTLPKLLNFILPSGGLISSSFHVSRAVCRRAEREVQLVIVNEGLEQQVAVYLNRLSDYLFTAARYCAMEMGEKETTWSRKTANK